MSWPAVGWVAGGWLAAAVVVAVLWMWATRGHRRREREAEWQGRIVTFRQGPRPDNGGRAGDPW